MSEKPREKRVAENLKMVFMGSPEFSIPSLRRLTGEFGLVACVTQPEKPRGRGLKVEPTPVKQAAMELGVPVVEPRKLSTPDFLSWLRGVEPDLCVGVAFGQIVPSEVLNIPPLGFVNVHPSLLPRLRGAAPIQRAIMNGEETTGVTTMYMDEGLDTGDIILQAEVAISPDDNYKSLHDRLAEVAADLVAKTVGLIAAGRAPRIPQDHSKATWAPHIKAEDEVIDWKKSAKEIVNQVRGLDPAPGASTALNGKRIKIWRARALGGGIVTLGGSDGPRPGEVLVADQLQGLLVATGDGIIKVEEIQKEGGRRMDTASFLRGFPLRPRVSFGTDPF